MTLFAEVVFPLPLSQSFSYTVPPAWTAIAKAGSRVMAPLGHKIQMGFIVHVSEKSPDRAVQLKDIVEVIDEVPQISGDILSFSRQLSAAYFSSWGEFLAASLPPSGVVKTRTKVSLTEKGKDSLREDKLTRDERKVAEAISQKPYSLFFLRKVTGIKDISSLAVRMEKKDLILIERTIKAAPQKKHVHVQSLPSQLELDFSVDASVNDAARTILRGMEKDAFVPFYLWGSSVKRQAVYFLLLQRTLARSKKALFLIPELSLAGHLQESLEKRLPGQSVFIHGGLSDRARELAWESIRSQKTPVVAGLRSALFSPVKNVGLVIVDEEHDDSYLQLENPLYDARRGAWLRAAGERAVLVYGSSTPSLEAFYRAQQSGYLLTLKDEHPLRQASVVDDKTEKGLISQKLASGLRERLAAGEPSIVFLNRRGYASFLFCPNCGYIPKCDRCQVSLAYHKKEDRLVCHYCRASRPKLAACPQCGSKVMEPGGAGVEAVEEELRRLFPRARMACFDSDRVKGKKAREKVLQRFQEGETDILIGTQYLAHQTGLPAVSLVGILNPEALLAVPDFRAAQRTYLALAFMMRLADEDNTRSETVIQTSFPDHHSIRSAAGRNYLEFYQEEIRFRRLMNYPPFSSLAEVLLQGKELRNLARKAREISGCVGAVGRPVEILGPAFTPGASTGGEKRVQLILRTQDPELLDQVLQECLERTKIKKSVLRYP
jgi:primosomal protein N' (replication factor Y) (superfamily II helicase)